MRSARSWGLGDVGAAESGLPRKHGFDLFFGYLNQHHAHNHFPDFLWRNEERVKLPNVVTAVGDTGAGYATEAKVYADDLFADEALKFVYEHQRRPFFLYWSMVIPHANNERSRILGDGAHVPDYGPYAAQDWPNPDKGQAAMVTRLDRDTGRLFDKLRELGIDEQTLVIFTSDNGPHKEGGNNPDFFRASGPFQGLKRSLYEGGIRVPTIARWPGKIPAGTSSSHVAYFGDLMATACELAGLQVPAGRDSISFLPALMGNPKPPPHPYLYWEFYEQGSRQAVRFGPWKAIRQPMLQGPVQLFRLDEDPGETRDLAQNHPEKVREAIRYLEEAHVNHPDWQVKQPPKK